MASAAEVHMLSFRSQDRERVARGEITVTFRLWKTPKVKAGKAYASEQGAVEVQAVDVIPAALVSEDDVAPSGCESVAAIWQLAGEHTKTRVGPDTLLYRVRFRYLGGPAPGVAGAKPPLDVDQVAARLDRMDRSSARGPWTRDVLRIIERSPRVPARLLAAELDWERLDFKTHVRRLKRLGLTTSFEIGYELTDLGRRTLAASDAAPQSPKRSRVRS